MFLETSILIIRSIFSFINPDLVILIVKMKTQTRMLLKCLSQWASTPLDHQHANKNKLLAYNDIGSSATIITFSLFVGFILESRCSRTAALLTIYSLVILFMHFRFNNCKYNRILPNRYGYETLFCVTFSSTWRLVFTLLVGARLWYHFSRVLNEKKFENAKCHVNFVLHKTNCPIDLMVSIYWMCRFHL